MVAKSVCERKRIPIAKIRREEDIRARADVREQVVKEYADDMEAGAVFRVIDVYYDGSSYWLADGYYRVAAAELIGQISIDANVYRGNRRDATLHAVGANSDHGTRRTYEDKRRAVRILLEDPEWSLWSDRVISEAAKVSHPFVSKMRKSIPTATREYVRGADGRLCLQRTRKDAPATLLSNQEIALRIAGEALADVADGQTDPDKPPAFGLSRRAYEIALLSAKAAHALAMAQQQEAAE